MGYISVRVPSTGGRAKGGDGKTNGLFRAVNADSREVQRLMIPGVIVSALRHES